MTATKRGRRRLWSFAALFAAIGTVLAPTTPVSATSEWTSGYLDGYSGALIEYGTFHYHYASGPFSLDPTYWDRNSGTGCGMELRFGLRWSNGDQVTQTQTWNWNETGWTKYFLTWDGNVNLPANYYAINGRANASWDVWTCGDAGDIYWEGWLGY